jgi:biotin-dependent carboxylase-like uncharacterized protein
MGVPVAGAMDQCAFRIGNLLVGNSDGDAAIEISFGRFKCKFLKETLFAVTGPNSNASLNGNPVPSWRALFAVEGDILTLGPATRGARDYLCIAGGVEVPLVLGSRSTYVRGKFGGFEGRALKQGDLIETGKPSGKIIDDHPGELIPPYSERPVLRVMPGPQDDRLSKEGMDILLSGTYEVTERTDRMGTRLQGPPVIHSNGPDIVSDATVLGSIQVPGNGQPLVLLADRPTTGGYVKPLTVVSFDIPLIAQVLPGWKVRFCAISLFEAREIHLKREYSLRQFVSRSRWL